MLGRAGAYLTHPVAAWTRGSELARILVLAAYTIVASYVVTLFVLLV